MWLGAAKAVRLERRKVGGVMNLAKSVDQGQNASNPDAREYV
jgi:hypothetical protein